MNDKLQSALAAAKQPPPNLVEAKAITDAPNLRERFARACCACQFAKPIQVSADPNASQVYADLMCTQFEFETEEDWVCDAFAPIPPTTDPGQAIAQAVETLAEVVSTQADEMKTIERYAVKFIGDDQDTIKGYRVLWGSSQLHDASTQKDYFDVKTDFMLDKFGLPQPLFYHHGFDAKTNPDPWIGTVVEQGVDEWGLWYKAQLRKAEAHDQYATKLMTYVRGLIASKALKDSCDGIPQYTIRENQANGSHRIKRWALVAQSLTPIPAEPRMRPVQELQAAYKSIGVDFQLPEADAEASAASASKLVVKNTPVNKLTQPEAKTQEVEMTEQELLALLEKREQDKAAQAKAEAEAKAADEARINARVQDELKKLAVTGRKLPFGTEAKGSGIVVASKYDDMGVDDLAFLAMLRSEAKTIGRSHGADEELLRALAAKSFTAIEKGQLEAKAMSEAEFKSNEVMQSTLASYGDEWVFSNISTQLWTKLRGASRLLQTLPQKEIPRGYESETIPLEGTDFTFYNMAQAASEDGTSKEVLPTVTTSKMGTGQRVITIGKLAGKGVIAGELDEDSIIDAIPEARAKLERQLPEELDFVLFNGDDTAATDNINGNGTPVSGADYTVFKGLIRLGLKTNTANAKDMGAALDSGKVGDFYALLGPDGQYVFEDPKACNVFCDYQTWLKAMKMSDLLTVSNAGADATIRNGAMADGGIPIFGVRWYPSVGVKKAQATGIRHGTEGSNTLGRAVLVRPDQWRLRWKRRAKFETQRVIDSDTTKIVVSLRLGVGYYDTDAAAVAYNI